MPPTPDFDLCAAVSSDETLAQCLARSPDVQSGGLTIRTFRGHRSAAEALNAALDSSIEPVVILAHEDVYLPQGFATNLRRQLETLERIDPHWAVVGCIGRDSDGNVRGETWSSGMQRRVGSPVTGPAVVETMDELILIVRRAAGVRFSPDLPGFHLYGTDIVANAAAAGARCYVLPVPVIHHSRPLVRLGLDYWRAYRFLRSRWRSQLPLPTMFGGIHRSTLPLARIELDYAIRNRGRRRRPGRTGDPEQIARDLGYDLS